MKKLALILVGFISPLILFAAPVQAQFEDVCNLGGSNGSTVCQGNQDTIVGNDGVITRVANVVAVVGGILAVIMLIIGGLMFILGRGDAGRIKIARETIVYSVVGLVVIVLARAIVAVLIGTT